MCTARFPGFFASSVHTKLPHPLHHPQIRRNRELRAHSSSRRVHRAIRRRVPRPQVRLPSPGEQPHAAPRSPLPPRYRAAPLGPAAAPAPPLTPPACVAAAVQPSASCDNCTAVMGSKACVNRLQKEYRAILKVRTAGASGQPPTLLETLGTGGACWLGFWAAGQPWTRRVAVQRTHCHARSIQLAGTC